MSNNFALLATANDFGGIELTNDQKLTVILYSIAAIGSISLLAVLLNQENPRATIRSIAREVGLGIGEGVGMFLRGIVEGFKSSYEKGHSDNFVPSASKDTQQKTTKQE